MGKDITRGMNLKRVKTGTPVVVMSKAQQKMDGEKVWLLGENGEPIGWFTAKQIWKMCEEATP